MLCPALPFYIKYQGQWQSKRCCRKGARSLALCQALSCFLKGVGPGTGSPVCTLHERLCSGGIVSESPPAPPCINSPTNSPITTNTHTHTNPHFSSRPAEPHLLVQPPGALRLGQPHAGLPALQLSAAGAPAGEHWAGLLFVCCKESSFLSGWGWECGGVRGGGGGRPAGRCAGRGRQGGWQREEGAGQLLGLERPCGRGAKARSRRCTSAHKHATPTSPPLSCVCPLRASQIRSDCPPSHLLDFLRSEAGEAADHAAAQVAGSKQQVRCRPMPHPCTHCRCCRCCLLRDMPHSTVGCWRARCPGLRGKGGAGQSHARCGNCYPVPVWPHTIFWQCPPPAS